MGLVDLRDRQDDAAVRALLASAGAGSAGGSVVVGWSEEGGLVACIAVARAGERVIELRAVVVAEPFRRLGVGRRLVDTVLAGAPVERFLAQSPPEAVGFFERCGFAVEGPGDGATVQCVRVLPAVAGPAAAVHAVTLAELEDAIRGAWGRDTSADPDEWTSEHAARGQCDATAVVVRSYLGGEILLADVVRDGRRLERHAWNRLPGGLALDLTRGQFRNGEELGEPVPGEPLLLGDAAARHALLAERVAALLGS